MKKILISQQAFFSIRYFISRIDTSDLSDHEKRSHEKLTWELEEKYNKLYDRMRYSEVLKADTEDDKKAMLDLYHKKKDQL